MGGHHAAARHEAVLGLDVSMHYQIFVQVADRARQAAHDDPCVFELFAQAEHVQLTWGVSESHEGGT